MIDIILNGKSANYEEELTINELIKYHNYSDGVVIVKYNGQIIKKDKWNDTRISEGDVVDLINFVGGG